MPFVSDRCGCEFAAICPKEIPAAPAKFGGRTNQAVLERALSLLATVLSHGPSALSSIVWRCGRGGARLRHCPTAVSDQMAAEMVSSLRDTGSVWAAIETSCQIRLRSPFSA